MTAALVGLSAWLPTRAPVAGSAGALGATGANGATGAHGATGVVGSTGGDDGATGAVGPTCPNCGKEKIDWGHKSTLAELRANVPYVPLPKSDLANDGNVVSVFNTDQGPFTVRYPGSISLEWLPSGNVGCSVYPKPELRTIDGVMTIVDDGVEIPGRQSLCIPVGPQGFVYLSGQVPVSTLVGIARTLSPSPDDVSPDGDLPPAGPPSKSPAWNTFFDSRTVTDVTPRETVEAASRSLGFKPIAPPSLGDPSRILELGDHVLSLRYDDAAHRRLFWLIERPSSPAVSGLVSQFAHYCQDSSDPNQWPECFNGETVDLGGGVSGVQFQAESDTAKTVWVEGGIFFEIVGSTGDANPDTAWPETQLPVAKAVAAALH